MQLNLSVHVLNCQVSLINLCDITKQVLKHTLCLGGCGCEFTFFGEVCMFASLSSLSCSLQSFCALWYFLLLALLLILLMSSCKQRKTSEKHIVKTVNRVKYFLYWQFMSISHCCYIWKRVFIYVKYGTHVCNYSLVPSFAFAFFFVLLTNPVNP